MIRRALSLLAILATVFAASRALVRALPGDPLETLMAETGTSIPREVLRKELGLDRPYFTALRSDAGAAIHGDLGKSMVSRAPVSGLIAVRLLNTLKLTLLALALGLAAALYLSLKAAAAPGSTVDRICSLHGGLAAALPTPWLGPMLLYVFGILLPVLRTNQSILLPALTLAIGFSGIWARLIRERVRETLKHGAAPGARARGLPEWKVVLKYGLAPASGALLAYFGTQLGALLAGAFVTEVIFDWPGMGLLLVDGVLHRDYPVVEAAAFVGAAAALLGNALGDWAQTQVDPRI